jgi:hypothetical protein
MSTRLHAPVLAVSLALAAIAPGTALAQCRTASHNAYGHAYQSYAPGARASASAPWISAPRAGRSSQTDPDPRIRFEMNRDDHDRRLGGS